MKLINAICWPSVVASAGSDIVATPLLRAVDQPDEAVPGGVFVVSKKVSFVRVMETDVIANPALEVLTTPIPPLEFIPTEKLTN